MTMIAIPPDAVTSPGNDPPREERVLLHNISWQEYEQIGAILRDRPALRLTYDRGSLEIMTTSARHEQYKKVLGRMLETLAEEFGLRILPSGSATFKREDLERGLEPDECFWIQHAAQMRMGTEWDARSQPPPDLVIEVEVTRSAQGRMAIYASLGVPEVWRFSERGLQVCLLQSHGSYEVVSRSPTFPEVPVEEISRFLKPCDDWDYLAVVREFRVWVRSLRSGK
jgi:Uma2 family endonuclease